MWLDNLHQPAPLAHAAIPPQRESGGSGTYRFETSESAPPELHSHCAARTHRNPAGCRRGKEARTEVMGDGSLDRWKDGWTGKMDGWANAHMNGWVGGWVGGWVNGDGILAEIHAYGQAPSHAGRRTGHAHVILHARTSRKQPVRPLSNTVLCHMCRILRCGNGRTGANLPRERVDRGDGTFCIEVDATFDCVPVAASRVAFEARTAPVRLVRDDRRALAGLLVVEA
jgi:hypothetical protein